ncbi:recombinase family protein [Falsiroseomonas sp. E2-1-a4]|uniref:recombinase family protein n=1 Tax=Falsiroseomonas sp. E2-1-a4 TaxID=3239299 RepID=UPI003F3726D3
MPATTKKLRCAVYTRKSTDEGLEKEFNTLDAQRDACEAYITSQRAEGWVLVRDRYDDGGFSGGTLERPALQRLLRDSRADLVDVIVVYKIDRRRPLDKGDVYKLLNNRTYVGEAAHKGQVYPGEHQGIVPRELWDRAHAVLRVSPRVRANQNRAQTPALLKGLIFGVDGRALSPTHARKNGRLYRYYVAQRVLKGDAAGDDSIVRRVSAAEIEAAVVDQVRALLRQPEIVVGTWRAARREAPDLTEGEVNDALHRLDPLWEQLFPAEQARIVRSLVERVVVGPAGADIRLRLDGLGGLVRDLTAISPSALMAAA